MRLGETEESELIKCYKFKNQIIITSIERNSS